MFWVHGYTMDATIWDPLWDCLPGFRHIGVDLPDHGLSGPLRAGDGLNEVARELAHLAAQFDARRLVGISFGGMVALQVAIVAGEAITTLVLGSPALGGGPQDPAAEACNQELARLYRERGAGPWMTERWMQSPPAIFDGAKRNPSLRQHLREIIDRHPWRELADNSMQRWTLIRQVDLLAAMKADLFILLGEDDMPAFLRSATLILRAVPNGRRAYLPAAGHLALLEYPEAAAALLGTVFSGRGA